MRRALALIVALGVVVFGSVALVSADCAYHKTQAAVDKPATSKEVATAPTPDKTDANQVQTAQAGQSVKPAPEVKK